MLIAPQKLSAQKSFTCLAAVATQAAQVTFLISRLTFFLKYFSLIHFFIK